MKRVFLNTLLALILSILVALPSLSATHSTSPLCAQILGQKTEIATSPTLTSSMKVEAVRTTMLTLNALDQFLKGSIFKTEIQKVYISDDPYASYVAGYAYRESKKVTIEIGTEKEWDQHTESSFKFALAHEIGHLLLTQYLVNELSPQIRNILAQPGHSPKEEAFLKDVILPYEELVADFLATVFSSEKLTPQLIDETGARNFSPDAAAPSERALEEYYLFYRARGEIGHLLNSGFGSSVALKVKLLEALAQAAARSVENSFAVGAKYDWNYVHFISGSSSPKLNEELISRIKSSLR